MQKTIKMLIKANYRVAVGHKPHTTGVGVHGDKRLKRQTTRQARNSSALKEWK